MQDVWPCLNRLSRGLLGFKIRGDFESKVLGSYISGFRYGTVEKAGKDRFQPKRRTATRSTRLDLVPAPTLILIRPKNKGSRGGILPPQRALFLNRALSNDWMVGYIEINSTVIYLCLRLFRLCHLNHFFFIREGCSGAREMEVKCVPTRCLASHSTSTSSLHAHLIQFCRGTRPLDRCSGRDTIRCQLACLVAWNVFRQRR